MTHTPIRSLMAYAAAAGLTLPLGSLALIAGAVGAKHAPGSLPELLPRLWARGILRASGVDIDVHGSPGDGAHRQVFVANHVSRYDVLALMAHLRNIRFVAKAELASVPLFGPAAAAVGTLYIRRENRTSSFETYQRAAAGIAEGASVVVFAEGSRGDEYALRPFKKGPFVLAIAAGAPIVPTIVHGGIAVHPRGKWAVRPGRMTVHFLDPIAVTGLTYEDRHDLATEVRTRMARSMEEDYGIVSPNWTPVRGGASA